MANGLRTHRFSQMRYFFGLKSPGPNNIFLPAGTTMNGPHVGEDGAKFQCCIHPWMRITVNGDETHGDHQLGGH